MPCLGWCAVVSVSGFGVMWLSAWVSVVCLRLYALLWGFVTGLWVCTSVLE